MNYRANSDLIARLAAAAPVLTALRDARSLTEAAQALGLHQTALSHRLRGIEEALGLPLFKRTTRSFEITEAGEEICEAAATSMEAWDQALVRIARRQSASKVALSLPSSLAMKWLVPALPRAQAQGVDLSFEVQEELIAPGKGGPDVAIRFGPGPYPGFFVSHLAHCDLQPVARPGNLPSDAALDQAAGEGVVFLRDSHGESDETGYSWARYFQALYPEREGEKPWQSDTNGFSRADLMLQAAIGGMGIALGRTLLIENDIDAGFLEPVGEPVRISSKYWVVTTPDFAQTDIFQRLLRWLRDEVARSREILRSHKAPTAG